MKLSVSEYRWIVLNCNIMLGQYKGKQYAVIDPKYPKYQDRLDRILGKSFYPTVEEWNKMARDLNPKRKNDDMLHHNMAVRRLESMSPEKLAGLNNKQRIEILDSLLVDVIGNDVEAFKLNQQTVKTYKRQIKSLLFGITLPKDFIVQEQARCDQFCNRLQSVPHLKEYLEGWPQIEFSQRKELAENILGVFNASYHTNIELKFFTKDEWRQEQKDKGLDPDKRIMSTAYREGNAVFINKERMAACNNLAIPPLIYHEALHVLQEQEDWSRFPEIDKLFERKFTYLALDQEDLYVMNPIEVHAYGMDERITDFLKDKMQIKYIEGTYPPELKELVSQTQEKARTMMNYSLYRNNIADK